MESRNYNLTFWQQIELIPMRVIWLFTEPSQRKSWHEVKKGMEMHEHKFVLPITIKGYRFLKCEHEGCNVCTDAKVDWQ